MTVAKGLFTKTDAETKSVVIDCAPALATGETIDIVSSETISPAGPTVSGLAKNSVVLSEPGERSIAAAEGLQFYVAGGTAGVIYTITIPYTTSNAQSLQASVKIKVVND